MREILFRGKPKNLKSHQWVHGQLLHHSETISKIYSDELDSPVGVIHDTVGQFTGLTDKNGKKIFEGDILDVMHQGIFECRWDSGNFEFGLSNNKESFGIAYVSPNDIFVIGNIHDNTELLGG